MIKENRVYCNSCGREIRTGIGSRMEDYFHMEKTWGYFSRKDGMLQKADICEDCMDRWMREFKISPEYPERTEIFEC
ncbi:MAG: hypothetical protein LIO75_06600 [Lachnospiraceae bacterium]|nr:hypothetical protein [Lachnospiraceae bacterium]